jgi:hypothetical protein
LFSQVTYSVLRLRRLLGSSLQPNLLNPRVARVTVRVPVVTVHRASATAHRFMIFFASSLRSNRSSHLCLISRACDERFVWR